MARYWKSACDSDWNAGGAEGFGAGALVVLIGLFIVFTVIFTCEGGHSKDKASSATYCDTYGSDGCGGGGCSSCGA